MDHAAVLKGILFYLAVCVGWKVRCADQRDSDPCVEPLHNILLCERAAVFEAIGMSNVQV